MIKRGNPRKKPVAMPNAPPRPSRIRRDPPAPEPERREISVHPTEREIWTVAIGVLMFAIAITILTLKISEYTS